MQRTFQLWLKVAALASFILPLALSCRSLDNRDRQQSATLVFDGKPDEQNHQATVRLDMKNKAGQIFAFCTGTVVRADLILTAAHCVSGEKLASVSVSGPAPAMQGLSISSQKFIVHPEYTSKREHRFASDIGFVVLPAPLPAGQAIATLATVPVAAGDMITMVGYGRNSNDSKNDQGAGVRRVGINVVDAISNEFDQAIIVKRLNTVSLKLSPLTAQGDSGGALYNELGEIVGVTSSGIARTGSPDFTGFVNIHQKTAGAFIANTLANGFEPKLQSAPAIEQTGLTIPIGQLFLQRPIQLLAAPLEVKLGAPTRPETLRVHVLRGLDILSSQTYGVQLSQHRSDGSLNLYELDLRLGLLVKKSSSPSESWTILPADSSGEDAKNYAELLAEMVELIQLIKAGRMAPHYGFEYPPQPGLSELVGYLQALSATVIKEG